MDKCRICLNNRPTVVSIFEYDNGTCYVDMMTAIANIKVIYKIVFAMVLFLTLFIFVVILSLLLFQLKSSSSTYGSRSWT